MKSRQNFFVCLLALLVAWNVFVFSAQTARMEKKLEAATDNARGLNQTTPMAIYKSSPSVLASGEVDGLQTDANHNLKCVISNGVTVGAVDQGNPAVSSKAWPVGVDIAPLNSDVHTGVITSNGTTKRTIMASSGALQVFWYGMVQNLSATSHTITFYSMPHGSVARKITLPANSGYGFSYTDNIHSIAGDSLAFAIDSGGVPTDCEVDGNAFYRAVWP